MALVDDEAPVRVALGRLLRLADYAVVPLPRVRSSLIRWGPGSGLRAARCAHARTDGFQVQARLRDLGLTLPVVFITASDDAEIERKALDAGGVRVLRKPFGNQLLLDAVTLALKHRTGDAG